MGSRVLGSRNKTLVVGFLISVESFGVGVGRKRVGLQKAPVGVLLPGQHSWSSRMQRVPVGIDSELLLLGKPSLLRVLSSNKAHTFPGQGFPSVHP